jgi:asparagine synthase (glutamine-hydrolysing)
MCGIAGEIRFDGTSSNLDNTKEMCRLQAHRGPDDDGFFADGAVSLGIRRLAIIDLTKGLYPITNERRDLHLIFNGEIYGYMQLRNELIKLGHQFSSNTDAETVIHAYEEWGTNCLAKFNGMFAFALWDNPKQSLWLVRDHFGIKPLYYYRDKKFFAFASEIKPLLGCSGVKYGPNENVIHEYLETGLVDVSDETFFSGIYRVMPAQHISIDPKGSVQASTYWKPSVSGVINGSPSATEVQRTRDLFLEAVDRQIVSDVSVGTCLSGGIDSSSIVCAIKKLHPNGAASTGDSVRTFSAVFPGLRIDESEHVSAVCEQTQSESNWVRPTADELWNDLNTLVRCQEEPFPGPSIYAQWRVMKHAKEHGLTVMLDGQGGDELFVGYTHYYPDYLMTLKRRRKFLTLTLEGLRSLRINYPFIKAYLKNRLDRTDGRREKRKSSLSYETRVRSGDFARSLEMDVNVISLPALLRYEDKNSMFHSLEARVPFLDRVLFDYVASLPLSHKLRKGVTKYVFRLAMSGILPEKVRMRKDKIGFEVPETKWIGQDLRDRLRSFFQGNLVAERYYDLLSLRRVLDKPVMSDDEVRKVWRILNLEVWYREFFPDPDRLSSG